MKEKRPIILGNRLYYFKDKDRSFGNFVRYKGSYIIYMLKNTIGDDKFYELLRRFYSSYDGKWVTYKDFENTVNEVCNADLTWFFDQWVRGQKFLS